MADIPKDDDDAVSSHDRSTEGSTMMNVEDQSIHDISYHPGRFLLYSPPQQRQSWGDSQILPRVNWGDTFYDLFFVAAVYNIGTILLDSPTLRGVLYFITCFGSTLHMWREKVMYNARFVLHEDDLYHRFTEAFLFLMVSFAIVHISPLSILQDCRHYPDAFALSLVTAIFSLLSIVMYLELYFFGVGQTSVLKRVAIRDISIRLLPFFFQISATVVAGLAYFGPPIASEQDSKPLRHMQQSEIINDRKLSSYLNSESVLYQNDVPIYLLLAAVISNYISFVISIQILLPNDGSHKQFTVPLNINFVLHRDGEWIMLMLGESILSLLIVDADEEKEYYVTFFCGIVTVLLFHQLHYRSQPHNPNHHATRRNKDAGIWWTIVNAIYSASLIAVGVSFKLFMKSFQVSNRRGLHEHQVSQRDLLDDSYESQGPAHLFSASMAIAFCCLDLMSLLHRGLQASINRCHCKYTKKKNFLGIWITIGRICLILFIATLSQYVTSPKKLSILGLMGVLAQLMIRRLGHVAFLAREEREALIHDMQKKESNSFLNRRESGSPSLEDGNWNDVQQDCQTDDFDHSQTPQEHPPHSSDAKDQGLPDGMSKMHDGIDSENIPVIPFPMSEIPVTSNLLTEGIESEKFSSIDREVVVEKDEIVAPVGNSVILSNTIKEGKAVSEESVPPVISKDDEEA